MKTLFYILITLIFTSFFADADDYVGWTVGVARNGYGTIYGTVDSGKNWVRQGSNQIVNADLSGIFAVNPSTAWVVGKSDSGYATIYNTIDGGQTWTRKGFGQSALQNIDLGKVHVSSNSIWAIGENAILRSNDNGDYWTNCIPAEFTNTILQGLFSIDGTVVWVSGKGTGNFDYATMLKTTDAGQTWIRQTGGDITNVDHLLGISAANKQTLWAVGGNGFIVLRSDDGGNLWTKQPSQGGLGDANEVSATDTQTVWVAVDNFVEWTHNGGQTWSNKTTTYYTMGISSVSKQEAWAAVFDELHSTGYVWHTSNSGETWENQLSSAPPLWTISFAKQSIPEPGFYLLFIICQLLFIIYRRKIL